MTRGTHQAPNADIQTGNGPAHPRGSPTGRGRIATWIRAMTWTRARSQIRAGGRIRARAWMRSGGWIRAGAIAGVVGPVGFTAAWIAGAMRQPGLSFAAPQISGLAAENARDPWLMISGFELLGACAIGFGAALREALGRRQAGPGPRLIQLAGLLTIATGLLRRDHVLLTSGPESWHNHAHDVTSAAVYVLLIAVPLLLARRFRGDRRWRGLAVLLVTSATVSAAVLVAFYAAPQDSWDATLQRIAVTLPLAAIVAVAVRLARLAGRDGNVCSPGDADTDGNAHPGRSRQPE
jgi:hypothetical membrane protein